MVSVQVDDLLQACVENEGSDLHIKSDSPPLVRIHGDLLQLDMDPLTPEEVRWLCFSVMSEKNKRQKIK